MIKIFLFHYTSISALPNIVRTGRLMLSESELSPKRRMAGRPVVWLTKSDDPKSSGIMHDPTLQNLRDFDLIDKTRIRFKVELPNKLVTRYRDWAKGQGIDRNWLAHQMTFPGANSWFVTTRPIEMFCWREVIDLQEDRAIWVAGPHAQLRGASDMNIEKESLATEKESLS